MYESVLYQNIRTLKRVSVEQSSKISSESLARQTLYLALSYTYYKF